MCESCAVKLPCKNIIHNYFSTKLHFNFACVFYESWLHQYAWLKAHSGENNWVIVLSAQNIWRKVLVLTQPSSWRWHKLMRHKWKSHVLQWRNQPIISYVLFSSAFYDTKTFWMKTIVIKGTCGRLINLRYVAKYYWQE